MFIYHRHIFVSYIIQQNNPVSKSLRYIIPWFLRNRSYRRRAPSYRRHPIKLPSSVIGDKFAYRRLAANLSGIIVQKHPPTPQVTFMVMNGRLTSLPSHVNQPSHSSNKAISNFDLETTRSRSWVWSKGNTIQSAQFLIDLLSFCFTSIR